MVLNRTVTFCSEKIKLGLGLELVLVFCFNRIKIYMKKSLFWDMMLIGFDSGPAEAV